MTKKGGKKGKKWGNKRRKGKKNEMGRLFLFVGNGEKSSFSATKLYFSAQIHHKPIIYLNNEE